MLPISAESRIATDSSPARSPSSGARLTELGERDQRHRAAADAVEERHHLRHVAVILTERAPTTPTTAPITIPSTIKP